MGETIPENVGSSELGQSDVRIALTRKITIVFLIASSILSLTATASVLAESGSNGNSTVTEFESPVTEDLYWAPAGFSVWPDDSNIAYKWADKNNCDNYGCITAEFISHYGCPNSFYAALNWLDADVNQNGSVVSYDNASLPSLPSMQIAKLTFEDIQGDGMSGRMAEISCR